MSCGRRRAMPMPRPSCAPCPTASTPTWAKAAPACRVASASASPSPAPCPASPDCSSTASPRKDHLDCGQPVSGLRLGQQRPRPLHALRGELDMTALQPANRAWTYVGLVIALFGAPAAVILFKLAGFTRAD